VHFEPALAPGARVREVRAGPRAVAYRTRDNGRDVHVAFDVDVAAMPLEIAVRHTPGWRLELPDEPVLRGSRSQRLKILDARPREGALALSAEGLAGRTYQLVVHRPDGRTVGEALVIPADGGDPRDGYVRVERRVGGL
jgi:hypothetical protein